MLNRQINQAGTADPHGPLGMLTAVDRIALYGTDGEFQSVGIDAHTVDDPGSGATELAELGFDEYYIGRVLGHVSKSVT
ncbi:MAG: hypothetical protein R6U35_08140, partial [Candidatus Humimicrobiaceae bacterium]